MPKGWSILTLADSGALKMPRQQSRNGDQGEEILVTTSNTSRAGTLTFDGDHATLTFERRIRHPIQVVWEALTEPEHLARWYMTTATIEGRAGGPIDFRTGPGQLHVTGRILVWEPPCVFEYEWKVKPWARMPNGEDAVVRWELRPEGEETLLTLTHRNLTRRSALGATPATHVVLERLEAQLAGVPFEDFRERVAEVQRQYRTRQEVR